jgi:FkbM family methyltransferase
MIGVDPLVDLQWLEIALLRLLSSLISCRQMIDVGAHHGHSVQPFLEVGWHVYAFEPVAANRERLERLAPGNNRLVIRHEAVSNATGQRLLHLALDRNGSLHEYYHSLEHFAEDQWHRKGPSVPIATVSLDDLADRGELPRHIGVMKVDTEGHDLAVLKGASRLQIDVVAVEFWYPGHPFGPSPSPPEEIARLMADRDYPGYLALCHDNDATRVLESSLRSTRDDSWGNIFFFHRRALDLFRRVQGHRDWHFAMQISATCDGLRAQLREKEAVIQTLAAAAREKEAVIQTLAAAAQEKEAVIQALAAAAQEKEAVIRALAPACTKENVFQKLAGWGCSALRRTRSW